MTAEKLPESGGISQKSSYHKEKFVLLALVAPSIGQFAAYPKNKLLFQSQSYPSEDFLKRLNFPQNFNKFRQKLSQVLFDFI